jgi:anti-anti-sigma factor
MICRRQLDETDCRNIMPLEIKIQRSAGTENADAVTIRLAGSLDTSTAPELERQMATVLAAPVKNIIFDLAGLKFISSAGLRVFATTSKTLQPRKGQESFVNLQPQVEAVFEVIKSLPSIAMFRDEAELDRYLALLQKNHPGNC